MLEDLFSVVKVRFNGDKADDDKKKTDIPKGLLFIEWCFFNRE